MAHEIEFVDGVPQICYSGEVPWHGLGKKVDSNLTPEQMMKAAGLNWKVKLANCFAKIDGKQVQVDRKALIRVSDKKVLTTTGGEWHAIQNEEAFDFFAEFVKEGELEMHTAGSLKGGRVVWALAKSKESFTLFDSDKTENYFLFSVSHEYGRSSVLGTTAIRVVCNNTLRLSLDEDDALRVRIQHRKMFNKDEVKAQLGLSQKTFADYEAKCRLLTKKKISDKEAVEYIETIFPRRSEGTSKPNRQAQIAIQALKDQPGAEFGKGTLWPAYNAVTFMIDHLAGVKQAVDKGNSMTDRRMFNAWFAAGAKRRAEALDLAVKLAA